VARDRGAARSTIVQRNVRPRDAAGGILVVGPLADRMGDPSRPDLSFFPASDGVAALRLVAHPGLGASIGVVFASAELPDMSGRDLLERVGVLLPNAARVLLVDDEEALPSVEELAAAGLDDAWITPADATALVRRADRERRTLARFRLLHRHLEDTRRALDRLEARYRGTRSARDQLAAAVRTALEEPADGPVRKRLERWWRDYAALIELREGRCPVHPGPVGLAGLVDEAVVRRSRAHRRSDLRHWQRARLDDVTAGALLDSSLAVRTLFLLVAGFSEFAATGAGLDVSVARERATLRLAVRLHGIDPALVDGLGAIRDPFARLPGGRLEGLSLDLVLVDALCEVQGVGLRLRHAGEALTAELDLIAA
jgi:hypothetical protein